MSYQTDLETIYNNLNTIKTNCNSALSSKSVSSISSLSGLPSAINSITSLTRLATKSGSFTPSSEVQSSINVTHGLGTTPRFIVVWLSGSFTDSQMQNLYSSSTQWFFSYLIHTPSGSDCLCVRHSDNWPDSSAGFSPSVTKNSSTFTISPGGSLSSTKSYSWYVIE